jgi:hypothetical protein
MDIVFVQDVIVAAQLGRLTYLTMLVFLYIITFNVESEFAFVAVMVIVVIFFGNVNDDCGEPAGLVSTFISVNGYCLSI